jgi:SAM-dependent methyltransferase
MNSRLLNRLQSTRKRIYLDLLRTGRTAQFSAATYSLDRALTTAIGESARGTVLDCGAGMLQHREKIKVQADSYESIDWNQTEGLTWIGDIQAMDMVPDNRYDTVFCSQVLEHLPRPWDALAEMFRVLKPGGRLIISAPHLSRLHEQPHDYFRYTSFGLKRLLEDAGFQVDNIRPVGGLLTFITHQMSTMLLALVWGIPVLRQLLFALNGLFLVQLVSVLDRILPGNDLFAVNYLAIALRPGD